MNKHEALRALQELSDAMEEDRIEISRLSSWDIDFLRSMSTDYESYKAGDINLTPKQITQIERIYEEQLGG